MSETMPLQPGQLFAQGRYVLIKLLGQGGMGEVWLARDERLNEPVALKFLPPEIRGDPAALDNLRRETSRSRKLTHPNIVRIHDLHEESDGMAFIVMEYVEGSTLAGLRVEQPKRVLGWDYLRPLVQQLCAALNYAHGEKVVHRDLKPANVMVDGKGRLKLADFGIAAVMSDSMSRITAGQTVIGTLEFMSPQHLAGRNPQAADDIYSLGATLYELLTSLPPFYTGDLTYQVLHEAPEPIMERLQAVEIQNEVPASVAAMIMACLAKEQEQRPPSAVAVAEWIGLDISAKTSGKHLAGLEVPPTGEEPTSPDAQSSGSKIWWLAGTAWTAVLIAAIYAWRLGHHHESKAAAASKPMPAAAVASTSSNQAKAAPETPPTPMPAPKPAPPQPQPFKPGTKFYVLAGQRDKPGAADGQGSAARFNSPRGLAFAPGALYVADTGNEIIRRVTTNGLTSTLAGSPGIAGMTDGLERVARFNRPEGIQVGTGGNVLVVDSGNNAIRVITKDNRVRPRAGQTGRRGGADGVQTQATFNHPVGIEMRAATIYVADSGNHTIRCITGTNVTTLAGKAGVSGSADGYAMEARFNQPMGVTVGREGDVYVADTGNNTIRKISALGIVTPVAGKAGTSGNADGRGSVARFNQPRSIRWQNATKTLYVEDSGNGVIRMVALDGTVTTLGGPSGDLAIDPEGNLYMADYRHDIILTTIPTGVEFTSTSQAAP
ncbi:MAG: serine/threonine-protein kinase [Verrucomicrobiota bacterium]|jgi:serine/threonine protein kinase/sugar lactone lactonase YvrE